MIPATISTMLSTTSPVTAPPKISVDNRQRQHLAGDRGRHHRQHLASTNYPDSVMISLRSSLEKLSAGARVIFSVAALLENTPFELYTLIRSGSLIQLQAATRNASGDHEPTHDLEICRDLPRPSGLQDSPLEGAGFELSVPREGLAFFGITRHHALVRLVRRS